METKKKFNKKLLLPVFVVLSLCLVYAGAVIFHNINATATVSEALVSTDVSADFSGYAGETIVKNFTVENKASVPLDVEVTWEETSNINNVTYTTDMTKTLTLAPGSNIVSVLFTYAEDTTLGDVEGTITLSRVA